jgi:hypothetical protein
MSELSSTQEVKLLDRDAPIFRNQAAGRIAAELFTLEQPRRIDICQIAVVPTGDK